MSNLYEFMVKQSRLEEQYEVLVSRGYSAKDIAFHLARFSEAHIFNAADRKISELESEIKKLKEKK